MAGLYLHIPFCASKCYYCDFYSVANASLMPRMIDAMCREITLRADFLSESINTVYVGGGTPSLCAPEQLETLFETAHRELPWSEILEFTLEGNPEQLTQTYLSDIKSLGINRLSIGVQSFDDLRLRAMNRRHSAQQACRAVESARTAGFDNLSIDLIYGVPGMTCDDLQSDLNHAIALKPEHLSAYHLSIEPRTVFGRRLREGVLHETDPAESQRQYDLLCHCLREAGYEHYEISNFALPGRRARHNSAYWHGVSYLGIGPSAHSFRAGERRWNVSDNRAYLDGLDSDHYYMGEQLSRTDAINEFIMTSLRTSDGLSTAEFKRRFSLEEYHRFEASLRPAVEFGNVLATDDRIVLPEKAFLISDTIISDLFFG